MKAGTGDGVLGVKPVDSSTGRAQLPSESDS